MRRIAVPEPLPSFIPPMLPESGPPAQFDDDWAVEVKFDGIRAQPRVDGSTEWTVRSRPGRNCTSEFPELHTLAAHLADHRVILDGELVHLGADCCPDFAALRGRLTGNRAARPATFVAFDVLHRDGRGGPNGCRTSSRSHASTSSKAWCSSGSTRRTVQGGAATHGASRSTCGGR